MVNNTEQYEMVYDQRLVRVHTRLNSYNTHRIGMYDNEPLLPYGLVPQPKWDSLQYRLPWTIPIMGTHVIMPKITMEMTILIYIPLSNAVPGPYRLIRYAESTHHCAHR